MIWLLVADEGKASVSTLVEFDVLDFSMLVENVLNVILCPMVWKVFYKEIASLFGCFVSHSISQLLNLPFCLFHGMADVKLDIAAHVFTSQLLNGLLGSLRPVLLADFLWVVIAHESKLPDVVFHEHQRLDVAVSCKHFSYTLLWHLERNIFEVNVVDEFPHRPSGVFGLELDSSNLIIIF